MSKPSIEKLDLHKPSTFAYVRRYKTPPDYSEIFDERSLLFLSFVAKKWNTKLGTLFCMLVSGVSFGATSNARIVDPSGHKLGLNTYILCPAPPGSGKSAAFQKLIEEPFLKFEGEWITLLQTTSRAGLLDTLHQVNGRVFWSRDEMVHHLYTMLSDYKQGETLTFRSNLNILYTTRTFRRNVCKKSVNADDVHFTIGGTGHPEHCLMLSHNLISQVDGLADRFYYFCPRASREPEVRRIENDMDSLSELYGQLSIEEWPRKLYSMIRRKHQAAEKLYLVDKEATGIIVHIKQVNMDAVDDSYEQLESYIESMGNNSLEDQRGYKEAL